MHKIMNHINVLSEGSESSNILKLDKAAPGINPPPHSRTKFTTHSTDVSPIDHQQDRVKGVRAKTRTWT